MTYSHKVQYYETDKMGITHHSNYVRWMEEARIAFLSEHGLDYAKLEQDGIISPVVSVSVNYRRPTQFSDTVEITVREAGFNGVRLTFEYVMECAGRTVCEAKSEHCFTDGSGRPVRLQRENPEVYAALCAAAGKDGGKA